MSSGKFIDLYKTLAVSPSATGAQIRAAFYKLAKTCHPDVTSTGSSEKFKCVNEAYQTLSTKRREYDLEYAAHFGKVPGAAEIEVRFKKASKAHPAYSETHMSDADSMREAFSHGWARSAWGPRSTFRSFKGGYGKHPGSFCWNDDNDLHDDNHGTSQFFDKHYEKTETDNDVDYAESRTRSGKANRSNWSSRNRTVNTWVDFDPDWIFDETAAPYDDVHHVRMSRRDGRYVLHGPGTNRLSKLKFQKSKQGCPNSPADGSRQSPVRDNQTQNRDGSTDAKRNQFMSQQTHQKKHNARNLRYHPNAEARGVADNHYESSGNETAETASTSQALFETKPQKGSFSSYNNFTEDDDDDDIESSSSSDTASDATEDDDVDYKDVEDADVEDDDAEDHNDVIYDFQSNTFKWNPKKYRTCRDFKEQRREQNNKSSERQSHSKQKQTLRQKKEKRASNEQESLSPVAVYTLASKNRVRGEKVHAQPVLEVNHKENGNRVEQSFFLSKPSLLRWLKRHGDKRRVYAIFKNGALEKNYRWSIKSVKGWGAVGTE